jgi:hypothetical protein
MGTLPVLPGEATNDTSTRGQPRSCIFCFQPADSGEHLLPCWLQKVLPSKDSVIHTREIEGDAPLSWTKRGAFKEKTKQVCETCNTGWMSRLEEAVKPILAPAIAREARCEFDLREQWLAALWAAKTTYVLQTQGPNLLIPPIHPFLLRENGMPTPHTSVFLGSHARAVHDPINSCFVLKPLAFEPEDEHLEPLRRAGYVAFLAVAGISFVIIEHRLANYVEVTLGDHLADLFTKIWPRSSKVVNWPPALQMDRQLVEPFLLMDEPPGINICPFPGSRHHMPPFSEAF